MCEAGFKKSVWCCWMLDSQLSFTKKCLWCSCRKLSVAGEEWTLLQWKELFCCMPTKLEPVCMCGDLNRFCSFHPSMKWWVAQTGLWLLILQKSLFTMKKNKTKKKQQILVEAENLLTAKPVWPERIYLIQCEVPSPLLHICCHALGGQHHSKWAGN